MRIGTWNVEYARGVEKNERRLRRLRDMDCDLWVLTETHDDLVPGPEYRSVSTNPRARKGPNARWTTIWSRFPLEPIAVADPARTVAAMVRAPTGPILVFGTVLPWHTDTGPYATARVWSEFFRVVPEQAREWAALRDAYPEAAMCVAGDLNMNLGGPHYYGTIKGRAMLRDGIAGAGMRCVTETELVPAGLLARPNIDHICVSEALAKAARVEMAWPGTDADGVRLSDHSGLVVTL